MRSRSRRLVILASVLTAGIAVGAGPGPVAAAGTCSADFVILGQAPGLTGPTSTDWFNVFGMNFDPSVPATLTFDVPVIAWSIDQPMVVQPAVTEFEIPAMDMSSGFKWTFRSRDLGVQIIRVGIAGLGCRARTVVDFSPPPTSTLPAPTPSPPSPAIPSLLLAFIGGALGSWRWLDRRPRSR